MKKCRSIVCMILAIVFVLTGCGANKEQVDDNGIGTKPYSGEQASDYSEEKGKNEYTYVQPEMKGEITISCLLEEEFLSDAAERFMDMYPDVKITINSYKESSGVNMIADYQTYLNTKIMTGDAEDIIFTNFLPIEKYSEMGVFEDISKFVEQTPEFNDENYYMNVIWSAKRSDGQLYLLPYMARFDTLALSDTLMTEQGQSGQYAINSDFVSAMELAESLVRGTGKQNVYLVQQNKVQYMDMLVQNSLSQFLDIEGKTSNFDSDAYIQLLQKVQELGNKGYLSPNIDFYNTEYYFASTIDYDVQAAFLNLDHNSNCYPVRDSQGNVIIKSNSCIAMNSACENKELVWEFMKYLLSEEIQSLPSIKGPAVNKNGLIAGANRFYNFYKSEDGNVAGTEEDYLKLLESWILEVNACDTLDSTIIALIEEENMKFFEGKQTAQQTGSNIQKKISQYLNE